LALKPTFLRWKYADEYVLLEREERIVDCRGDCRCIKVRDFDTLELVQRLGGLFDPGTSAAVTSILSRLNCETRLNNTSWLDSCLVRNEICLFQEILKFIVGLC
jgi:hypothetical protein